MQTVLSLDDATIRYGERLAVDGLTLQVHAGEVFGLLGPNGSGKSSTLSAIVGATPLASGSIRILGRCPYTAPLASRRLVGLVPQELALYEDLQVEQNVSFFGRLYGIHGAILHQRVAEVLDIVRLSEERRRVVRTLSGGMQRRLNLACALLHQPALLLLDEPTVGLDIQSRDAIFASLRRLRDRGLAIVFTTHHLEEVELLCDRIGIMRGGQLQTVGPLRQLLASLDAPGWRADGPHSLTGPRRGGLERVYLDWTGSRKGETLT